MHRSIRTVALAAALFTGSACGDDPTSSRRAGSGEITLTTVAGVQRFRRAEAGAHFYSVGSSQPEKRAFYLTLAAGDTTDTGIEIEFSAGILIDADLPPPGTYTFAADEPVRVDYGSNLIWTRGRMRRYYASQAPSTLTIETATAERITGRFSMQAIELYRTERVTITGVFSAKQVERREDLPRAR
jgi:hypothetical protein